MWYAWLLRLNAAGAEARFELVAVTKRIGLVDYLRVHGPGAQHLCI